MKFTDHIKYIPKIGERRAGVLFAELGIKTLEDLLLHFPYKYIDVRRFYRISELSDNMPHVQLHGRITDFEMKGQGRSRRLVGYFTDGSELMELVWFAGEKYVTQKYSVGQEYVVFGKPKRWGKVFTMPHPEIEPYEGENRRADIGFRTMYNTTDTMKKHYLHSSALRDIIANLLNNGWQAGCRCRHRGTVFSAGGTARYPRAHSGQGRSGRRREW